MVTEIPQPVVSTTKFNALITKVLALGGKTVKELYQLAFHQQPEDCPNVLCPHRKKTSKSMEWQHEIQRQLARLATNVGGVWHLKNGCPPPPTQPPKEIAAVVELPVLQHTEAVGTEVAPYTGDPFIVTMSGNFMDVEELKKPEEDRFVVPRNFDEFYAWRPDYISVWVKRRLGRFIEDDDVQDWTQDLIIHMKYLPQTSKHRVPGANGHTEGCKDVIETFDPIRQYGASERRFRNYVNFCLANKFNTVASKGQKNPVCRPGTLSFGHEDSDNGVHNYDTGDEFVHANSEVLVTNSMKAQKQQDDRLLTNEFKRFAKTHDPTVVPAIEALEVTSTSGDAARYMGVSDGEFTRLRNRLKQMAVCFTTGTPVPKQRRPYKKRGKEEEGETMGTSLDTASN